MIHFLRLKHHFTEKIMCGDIPKGCYAKDVTVVFNTNQTRVRLPLPYRFENVKQIRLREAFIRGAGGAGLWRLQVNPDQIAHEVSNASGEGSVIGVDNTTVSHTIFTNPRTITDAGRGSIIDCVCSIVEVSGTGVVSSPTFTQAFFVLQFIMEVPFFDVEATIQRDRQNPLENRGQFSTKAPFHKLF